MSEELVLEGLQGAFVESLKRNNKKIREDRAVAIANTTVSLYENGPVLNTTANSSEKKEEIIL
jgi:hypothetical protein